MTKVQHTDAQIREAAYFIWREAGQPEGRDTEHWLKAIDALKAAGAKGKTAKKTAAKPTTAKKAAAKTAAKKTTAKAKAPRKKAGKADA
ncbi:DUF2934 domain-containing protein [Yoonia sediminilitoris]|uniref:DUF2934 family protein n=1 Tax=Yoonia sediminilitoris TaxID=1286148 RepID=A0A2T6KLR1_9RHOB|nr:DUF2934 domain-containing protein [Yoonia sediminilitoris]PUB17160.1 Protein of unknown function (DUF2934) [Yoonia sediminilitoris]RCW97455.1 DUF2934 family protein [Yoonia sediminilitoris]